MDKFEIKSRFTGDILFSLKTESLKLAVAAAVKSGADLRGADLSGAYLRGAYLRGADLREAYLSGADLRGAYLRGADLREAYLSGADLSGAKIKFNKFPSITTLSQLNLGKLPDDLTLELMRRDAYAHPHPERFNEWAKGRECPYRNEERFWEFEMKKELWRKGRPKMTDRDLIVAICNAKKWKIK